MMNRLLPLIFLLAGLASASDVPLGLGPVPAAAALVTSTGSTTQRTIADRFADWKNVKDFGAQGNGVADDTTAIQAALNTGGNVIVPPGTYITSSALNITSSKTVVYGYGRASIIQGNFAAGDIVVVGDGTNPIYGVQLCDLRIASSVVKTSGAGLHMRKMARSGLRGVICDGQDGNGNLYDGFWFDSVDADTMSEFESRGSNVGVKINGAVSGAKADLLIGHGKVASCSIGMLVGGAFGGLTVHDCVITANATGVQVDTSLVAEKNRELFFGSATLIDANTATGIKLNDTLASASPCQITGAWIASSPVNIDVTNWPGILTVTGNQIYNASQYGIRLSDTATTGLIGGNSIRSNTTAGIFTAITPSAGLLFGHNQTAANGADYSGLTGAAVYSRPLTSLQTVTGSDFFGSFLKTSQDTANVGLQLGRYNSGFPGGVIKILDTTGGANNPAFLTLQNHSGGDMARLYDATNALVVNGTSDDGANKLQVYGSIAAKTAGSGLQVKEGTNAKQGTATLVAGSAVVANTSVTANSRIFLTENADGGTPGWCRVSARTAGTSFTITSSSGTDTSTVAYEIFEPAP